MISRRLLRILPAAMGAFLVGSAAHAQIPQLISYQGMITNLSSGQPIPNGAYSMTFKIYTTPTGGAPIWQETQTGVLVNRGLFNVQLGVVTPLRLSFSSQYYLGTSRESDPEMQPRTQFASAPYAYRAIYADTSVYATFAQSAVRSFVSDSAVTVRDGSINSQKIANGAVTLNKIDTTGATPGQVLTRTATGLAWAAGGGSGNGTITGITTSPNSGIGVSNGNGPVTTISILPTGIIEPFMHDDAVSTRVIRDAAVTPRKIDPTGSVPGQALTSTGNGVVWGYPIASAIILPYHATQSAGVPLWWMTNTGAGSGVRGDHDATTGISPGVEGYSNSNDANASAVTGTLNSTSAGVGSAAVRGTNSSTNANGYGVAGTHSGTGAGVYGQSLNGSGVRADGGTYGVEATTINGIAVWGTATGNNGRAASFSNTNVLNTADVVTATTTGTGNVYRGTTGSSGDVFSGATSGTGDGIDVTTTGTGRAAVFTQSNGASTANVVEASGNSSGNVYRGATTGSGDIFNGTNNGTGDGIDVTTSATGTGWAGRFTNQNPTNAGPTLGSTTNGTGPAINGTATGTGSAGTFVVNNTLSAANALTTTTNGSGTSLVSTNTGSGRSGLFQNTLVSNGANVVEATTASNTTGHVFQGSITGSGSGDVFNGSTSGSGDGVDVTTTGTGVGGRFTINNTVSSSSAINASTNGTGRAALFTVNNAASAANAVEAVSNSSGDLYAGTQSGVGDGVDVSNTGTAGTAGRFTINNATNANAAVTGTSNGTGATISGTNTGTGGAGSFVVNNAASAANAVVANTNGTGNVYTGTNGTNGSGDIFNGTNNGPGDGIEVTVSNTGTGRAAVFTSNNLANTNNVVTATGSGTGNVIAANATGNGNLFFGRTTGNGNGVDVTVNGTGYAGLLAINNATSAQTALRTQTNGTGLVGEFVNSGTGGGVRIAAANTSARGLEVTGAPQVANVRMGSLGGANIMTGLATSNDGIVTADVNGDLTKRDAAAVVGSFAWTILGNNGINDAVNFLGTINLADLVIKTNNTERGRFYKTGEFGVNYGTATAPTAQVEVVAAGTNRAARFQSGNAANVVEVSGTGSGNMVNATTTGTGNVFNGSTSNSGDVLNARTTGAGDGVDAATSGTGRAGVFAITSAANVANALEATTNGTGNALATTQTGTAGSAANFSVTTAANASNVVNATTLGSGNVFRGTTSSSGDIFSGATSGTGDGVDVTTTGTGRAGVFAVNNAANSNNALEVTTNGTGNAGSFSINNAVSPANVVQAQSNGSGDLFAGTNTGAGDGVDVTSTGTGTAGRFTINNAANTNAAVTGTSNGTGATINGTNTGAATGGGAATFAITNAANLSNAVTATTAGTGNVFRGTTSSSGDVFNGAQSGTGDGIEIVHTGTSGRGGSFTLNNLANTGNAVEAVTSGTGNVYNALITAGGGGAGSALFNGLNQGNGGGVIVEVRGTGNAGSFTVNNVASNTTALTATTNGVGRAGSFTNNSASNASLFVQNSNAAGLALDVNGTPGTPNTRMTSLGANAGVAIVPTDGIVMANNTGVLRREDPAAVIGNFAWLLTGNSITSAYNGVTGQFMGTTNTQPLVVGTTNTVLPQPVEFFTNNTERARITATGDFGVGTTTPNARLGVDNSTGTNPAARLTISNVANTANALEVSTGGSGRAVNATATTGNAGAFSNNSGANAALIATNAGSGRAAEITNNSATNPALFVQNSNAGGLAIDVAGTGGTPNIRANSLSANTGAPVVATDGLLLANNTGLVRREDPAAVIGGFSWLLTGNAITSAYNGATGQFVGTTNTQPLVIATTNVATQDIRFMTGNTERARFTGATGRLGINQPAPNAQLDVNAAGADVAFNATANNVSSVATVLNSGAGNGLSATANAGTAGVFQNNAAVNPTLSAANLGAGNAVNGSAQAGTAGRFQNNSGANAAVVALNIGAGSALDATATTGSAGNFTNNGATNTVNATNTGTGNGLRSSAVAGSAGSFANNSAVNATVDAQNSGTGPAIRGVSSAGTAIGGTATTGRAGEFVNNSGTNPAAFVNNAGGSSALLVTNTGAGNGITATAGNNTAGDFSNNSAGSTTLLVANANAAGRALQVNGTAGTANVRMGSLSGATVATPLAANDGLVIGDNNGDLTKRSAAAVIGSLAWALTGNAGTNPATNFLGTTDANDLVIRTNNLERARITAAGVVQVNGTGFTTAATAPSTFGAAVTVNANETVNGNYLQTTGTASFTGTSLSTSAATPTTFGGTVTANNNVIQNLGTANFNGTSFATGATTPATMGNDLTVNGNTGLGMSPIPAYRLAVQGTAGTPNVRMQSLGGVPVAAGLTGNEGFVIADNNGDLVKRDRNAVINSVSWSLRGNTGTTPGTGAGQNYLGTADAQDFIFATNALERMRITAGGSVNVVGTALTTSATTPTTFNGTVAANGASFTTSATTPSTFNGTVTTGSVLTANGAAFFNNTVAANGASFTTGATTPSTFGNNVTVNGITGLGGAPVAGFNLAVAGTAGTPNTRIQSLGANTGTAVGAGDGIVIANSNGDLRRESVGSVISSAAWSLTGNAGTTAANFIGTTDAQPLRIRTNNADRVIVSSTGSVDVQSGGAFTTAATAPSTFGGTVTVNNTFTHNTGSANFNGSSLVTNAATPSIFNGTVQANNTFLHTTGAATFTGSSFTINGGTPTTLNGATQVNNTFAHTTGAATFTGASFATGAATPATLGSTLQVNGITGLGGAPVAGRNLTVAGTSGTPNVRMQSLGSDAGVAVAATDGIVVANNAGDLRRESVSSVIDGVAWSRTGNNLTGSEFLGSLNAQPLVFRTNSITRATITAAGSFDVSGPAFTTSAGTPSTFGAPVTINANETVNGGLTQTTGAAQFNGTSFATGATTPATIGNNLTVNGLTGLGAAPVAGFNLAVAGTAGTPNTRIQSLGANTGTAVGAGDGIVIANASGDLRRESVGSVISTTAWSLTGNAGTGAANFIGTTDAQPLRVRTNSADRLIVSSTGSVDVQSGAAFTTAATAPSTFGGTVTVNNTFTHATGNASFVGAGVSTGATTPTTLGGTLTANNTSTFNGAATFSNTVAANGASFTTSAATPSTLNGIVGIGIAPVAGFNLTVNGTAGTPNVRMTSLSANSGTALGAGDGIVIANATGDLRRESATNIVGGLAWSLAGNAATGADFLGTTNTQSLRIRTNGTNRLVIDGTTGSVDVQAGSAFTTSATSPSTFNAAVTVNANETVNGAETVNGNYTQTTGTAQFNGTSLTTSATTPSTFNGTATFNNTVAANGASFTTSAATPSTLNGIVGIGIAPVAGFNLTVNGTAGTPNVRFMSLGGANLAPAMAANDGILVANTNGDISKRTVASVIGNTAWTTTGNAGTTPGTGGGQNYIGTSDAQALVVATNATERIRVLSTGQVGINTTTPGTSQLAVVASGTNEAGNFSASNGTYALQASQAGTGTGLNAVNTGTGSAANVQINNAASGANALTVSTNGTGNGINVGSNTAANLINASASAGTGNGVTVAMSGTNTGYAGSFTLNNSAGTSDALIVSNSSTSTSADAVQATVTAGGGGAAVRAVNNGNGDGVNSTVAGTGYAGDFTATNAASTTSAIRARQQGAGRAGEFINNTAANPTVQITNNNAAGIALRVDGTAGTPNVQMASLGGAPVGAPALGATDGILVSDNSGNIRKYSGASLLSTLGISKGVYTTVTGATTHVITVPATFNLAAGATVLVTYRDPAAGAVVSLEVTTITTGLGGSFTVVSGAGVPAGSEIHWQVLNP